MPATIGILTDLRPIAVELAINWIIWIEEPRLTTGHCRVYHLHTITTWTWSWWRRWRRWRRWIGTSVGVDFYIYFCDTGKSILSISIYGYSYVSGTHITKVIGFRIAR